MIFPAQLLRSLSALVLVFSAAGAAAQPLGTAPLLSSATSSGAARLLLAASEAGSSSATQGESAGDRRLGWDEVSGRAQDLAIGADGSIYAVGTDGAVWRWDAKRSGRNKWARLPGRLKRIAAGPDGVPWGISSDGRIWRFQGFYWEQLSGSAQDIAVGADGTAFVIETDGAPAAWSEKEQRWVRMEGLKGERIAVDPSGRPWIVTATGRLHHHDGKRWFALPDLLVQDIAIGPQGTVYAAGRDGRPYRWNPHRNSWEQLQGTARAIAVGPGGRPWLVGEGNRIYGSAFFGVESEQAEREPLGSAEPLPTSREPIEFVKVPGAGRDIGIGEDGSIFLVDPDGFLMRWSNARERFLSFPALLLRSVAVSPRGDPWVVTLTGQVFRHDGEEWRLAEGIGVTDLEEVGVTEETALPKDAQELDALVTAFSEGRNAVDVAVGADGTVIASDAREILFKFDEESGRFERLRSPGGKKDPRGARVAVDPRGKPWVVRKDRTVFRCDRDPCQRVATRGAIDIAVGPEGSVMIADQKRRLRRFNTRTGTFERLDAAAEALAIGPRGRPWVVTPESTVLASSFFERDESEDRKIAEETVRNTRRRLRSIFDPKSESAFVFTKSIKFETVGLPLGASPVRDVSISGSGIVVLLDAAGQVNVFNPVTETFTATTPPTNLASIAVEFNGRIWGARAVTNDVVRLESGGLVVVPGLTPGPNIPSVAIGANGDVFATSADNRLFRFDPTKRRFLRFSVQPRGSPDRVAVDSDGDPWVVDSSINQLYEFTGSEFVRRPGEVVDVAIGASGSIFVVLQKGGATVLRKWNATNQNFDKVNRTADAVAVAPDGRPWVSDAGNTVILRAR